VAETWTVLSDMFTNCTEQKKILVFHVWPTTAETCCLMRYVQAHYSVFSPPALHVKSACLYMLSQYGANYEYKRHYVSYNMWQTIQPSTYWVPG
jgi:hypothetical protein